MQITLQNGDSIANVLAQFESKYFPVSTAVSLTDLAIRELKEITDFLGNAFTTTLEAPKRNSKVSLALWIQRVLTGARELMAVSEEAIAEPTETSSPCPNCGFAHEPHQNTLCDYNPETDSTSGLVISFGKTLEYLPEKTVTRRTWKETHAQKFINAFNQNKLVRAFDKDVRYGGKQIGWCRLLCAPYKERLCDMPEADLLAEGGMCSAIGEFIQQYFDGNPRLEVWVIRFEFVAEPEFFFAADLTPVSEAIAAPTEAPVAEIEVLEPEAKPVYTISIIADGSFSEERVNRLPPYLIDRKGNLLKRFWHRSCDAGYSEITSENLSNIAVSSGLVIRLMAEDLEVLQACIAGDPPPFIVYRGGAYKRDRLKLSLSVRYVQVVCEHLSNIVVVGAA